MLAGDAIGGGKDAVVRSTRQGCTQYRPPHREWLRSSTARSQVEMGVTPHIIVPG